jgi:hypothetical protein
MLFQTFSAEEGRWGAVREASLLSDHPHPVERVCTSSPAVIDRTVYWSCCSTASDCWDKILALDVDEAKETLMKLPPGCFWFCKVIPRKKDSRLLLASVRGRLSLLVSELTGITMWTLTPASSSLAATWSPRLVIGVQEIQRQVGDLVRTPFTLEEFGERSGTVILHLEYSRELFRLDLASKEETPVVITRIKGPGSARVRPLFLHETDLISLLQAMKYV